MKGEEKLNMEQQPPPAYGSDPYQHVQHQQQPPMVVKGRPMIVPKVGKLPEVVTCLNCRAEVRTRVERSLSQNGWIWSFVLWYGHCFLHHNFIKYQFHLHFRFLTGCCCFIPCVMDAFHDYVHQCPNCGVIIGKSTPDDREAERKKGLKVVIGARGGAVRCQNLFIFEREIQI